jgi:hypothetical protein
VSARTCPTGIGELKTEILRVPRLVLVLVLVIVLEERRHDYEDEDEDEDDSPMRGRLGPCPPCLCFH